MKKPTIPLFNLNSTHSKPQWRMRSNKSITSWNKPRAITRALISMLKSYSPTTG